MTDKKIREEAKAVLYMSIKKLYSTMSKGYWDDPEYAPLVREMCEIGKVLFEVTEVDA